jgi:hypothetical protein
VHGSPDFQLVPLNEGDDLIDKLIEEHPGFRRLLEERLREREVRARRAVKQL